MTKNGKLAVAGLAVCAIAFFPQGAFAHSGGLDSSGCHAGTQPYHCHRSSKDDEKKGLAIVGGLLVLWLIFEVIENMKEDDESTSTAFSLESPEPLPFRIGPYISPKNEIGMAAEYSSEKFGIIGFNTMTERSSVGLHWEIEF